MSEAMIQTLLRDVSVLPVMVIQQPQHAVPMAKALFEGGLTALEITLRSECALQAIVDIKAAIPEAIIGAGTVTNPSQASASVDAGVDFIVTPGMTPSLLNTLKKLGTPALPGASTVSEMMMLREHGFYNQKLFPAAAVGGTTLLKSAAGPLADLRFCPTGGITEATAAAYLALDNVLCIGGSWMLPAEIINAEDWECIFQLARSAHQLKP